MANRVCMRNRRASQAAAAFIAAVIAISGSPATSVADATSAVLPADVRDFANAVVTTASFPTIDPAGVPNGSAQWRLVENTGNCCENYLGTTESGRLLDFGGTYLRFSDDAGRTWKEVRGLSRLVNGEGAVVSAPNGDIIGATWDPYSGDHLLAFKYDAKDEAWSYMETVLHTPFYDRPWIALVPGPFTVGGTTVPYISILRGGWPSKGLWLYSLDGLNYVVPAHRGVDQVANAAKEKWLDVKPGPAADWIQPITYSGITPFATGGALATEPDLFHVGKAAGLMETPDIRWSSFSFPGRDLPPGRMLVDSTGVLHHLAVQKERRGFVYSLSADRGRNWNTDRIDLPARYEVEEWDFKAHGALGLTALSVHAHEKRDEVDQDFVYKFSLDGADAELARIFVLGEASEGIGSGVLSTGSRFDFSTVTILPSGKIATSFIDSSHQDPVIAIEL